MIQNEITIKKNVTVNYALSEWKRIHYKSDPRLFLDRYFCGYIFVNDYDGHDDYKKIEHWCKCTLGEENYIRIFNKFWFTSIEELTMFRLTWANDKLGIKDE